MIRLQQSGRALGSEVSLTLVVKKEGDAKPIFQTLWTQISAFEQRFSRFKTDSELTQLNSNAGEEAKISSQMRSLLKLSQELEKKTKGLFNPLTLPALQKAGYIGSWPMPDQYRKELNYSARQLHNLDQLKLTATTARLPADSALDFGGIGKGYLLDHLAETLDTLPVKGYWLSLGGDIISKGFDHEGQPWRLGIAKAHEPQDSAGFVINKSGDVMALATSGVTKRRGGGWHHIIDPRTGKPAETNVLTASVAANNAALADVYAKCLVIDASMTDNLLADSNITAYLLQISQNEAVKTIKAGAIS